MFRHIWVLAVFAALKVGAVSRLYMTEKPEFFESCSLNDSDFNECYANNLQALILNYKNGIPDLPSVGTLEPVTIRKLKIGLNQLDIEMRNISIHGLTTTNITSVLFNRQNLSILIKASMPKVKVAAQYKTNGRILFLPISGNGNMTVEAENSEFAFLVRTKLYDDETTGITFGDLQYVRCKVLSIGGFHIDLTNLFNGNKELENYINEFLNLQWHDILEMLQPTLEKAINAVLLNRFKKIFNFIPARYIIEDIPTAKQFYNQ